MKRYIFVFFVLSFTLFGRTRGMIPIQVDSLRFNDKSYKGFLEKGKSIKISGYEERVCRIYRCEKWESIHKYYVFLRRDGYTKKNIGIIRAYLDLNSLQAIVYSISLEDGYNNCVFQAALFKNIKKFLNKNGCTEIGITKKVSDFCFYIYNM